MFSKTKTICAMLVVAGFTAPAWAEPVSQSNNTAVVEQQSRCSGVVKDANGDPIIGASILVKGTTKGASTGVDGDFTIANVKRGSVITINYIGYQPAEVTWNGGAIDVTLKENAEVLDEVVIVGYGTQKKVNVTGAVSMVDSKVLESRPVQNVAQALQGQIPGLTMSVNNSGGALDNQLEFTIRGNGTIGTGSSGSPLVLIDGIEGNMNTVNPNDIAHVSVLKDAASASIYGARAAFGVILITTKNGSSGKTRVNYTGNLRLSTAVAVPDMVSNIEFANYFNTANQNGGGSAIFSQEVMDKMVKYNNGEYTDPSTPEYYGTIVNPGNNRFANYNGGSFANTDWFEEFYRSNAPAHEHNLSISGGTEKVNFVVSGNILNQQGLLRHGSDEFNRFTLNGKLSVQLASWAKMNFTTKWTREDFNRPTYLTGLFFHNIARRWPTCFVKDPYGNWAPDMEIIQLEEGGKQTSTKDWNTNQLQFIFEPIKDWHINVEGSMRRYHNNTHWAVLPIYGHDADNNPYLLSWDGRAAGASEVQDAFNRQDYFSTNIYSDYSKTINGHYFKVLGGFNAELYRNAGLWGFGNTLIAPSVPQLNTTQENHKTGNSASELALAGFFGRVNYNYLEKYIFEANLRYDGSSRFVGDKRWGLFPSFSAGWNLARESFFEPLAGEISTLKVRGSWGQLGNNEINSYYPFYQSMPTGVANAGWLVNGQRGNTSSLPGIVSSLLTWETITSWDLGFDFAALNNRLTGSFSYYNRLTKDMVATPPQLPGILGATPPALNNADLKSYGWEVEIQWRDRIDEFNYGVRFVLDDNQEEITRYDGQSGLVNSYYVGKKMGEIWGYTSCGLAQSQEQMDEHLKNNKPNWGSGWQAGDLMYKDLNGDGVVNNGSGTLDEHGDLRVIGNATPRFKFGLTLDGSWKGFDFSVFLQGVMKRDYMLGGPYFWGASGGMWQSACFSEHLDYWTEDNRDAYYPRPYFNTTKNQQTSTGYLQNAAYCRIKNAQIGYTLPKHLTSKVGMESLRVYISGDNLATFTSVSKIFDAETLGGDWGNGKLYPLQRTISFGLNVNF